MKKHGVLLINLGTPAAPTTPAVRAYLNEFLSDPCVIDLPVIARFLLLQLIILPFRSSKSAEAYQQIWTDAGSPLMVHSVELQQQLQAQLGETYQVELSMRYGQPSIYSALQKMQSTCDQVFVVSLFPQFALATNISVEREVNRSARSLGMQDKLAWLAPFYAEPWYIESLASSIQPYVEQEKADCLLLSYHGLPVRQLEKAGANCTGCERIKPCPHQAPNTDRCYRAQCYATSERVAQKLSLKPEQYQVSFQSRLGRIPWIQPYTDELLPKLREQGISRLLIACPAFVADCLETLEEIGMRAKQQWLDLGGESLTLIPCLNAQPVWVESLTGVVQSRFAALPVAE